MVEEEPQQVQVAVAQVASQEEVVPQPAVEVLDDRTGPRGVFDDAADLPLDGGEAALELVAQWPLGLPVGGGVAIQRFQMGDLLDPITGYVQPLGQDGELVLLDADECQQIVTLFAQRLADRSDAVRAAAAPLESGRILA